MRQNLMILARLGDLRTRPRFRCLSSAGPPLLQRSLSSARKRGALLRDIGSYPGACVRRSDASAPAPQDVFLRFRSVNITKIGIPRAVCFGQVGGADEDNNTPACFMIGSALRRISAAIITTPRTACLRARVRIIC